VTGTLWPRAAALFLAGVLGFGVGAVTWATTHQAMPMPMPVAPAVNDAEEPVAFVVASGWGMPYQRMGEVLVRVPQGVLDPARVGTDAWAASPPHAAVEFDPALGYVGVGAARDSLGREYLTGVIGG
jgi:hypothetical protein